MTRKRYTAEFKARVALEAIEGMAGTVSGKTEAAQACREGGISRLHAKIGLLLVERDFLAKASGR